LDCYAIHAIANRREPASNARALVVIRTHMAFSMRALLAADTSLPAALRAGIANGDPASFRDLMSLGVSACDAAELLDQPCAAEMGQRRRTDVTSRV